jgi:hypothetical protein
MAEQHTKTINDRTQHLFNLKVFEASYSSFPRGPKHGIKRYVKRWLDQPTTILNSPLNYHQLKHQSSSKTRPDYSAASHEHFIRVPSEDNRHEIRDNAGNVLAVRFRVPIGLIEVLARSTTALPVIPQTITNRGAYTTRHYGMWADYSKDIFLTSEHKRDQPASDNWFRDNEDLFRLLTNNLRVLNPEMYLKYTRVDPYLPAGLTRMAGAWHGVAINTGMVGGAGTAHIDHQDDKRGYNCVLPFGTYTGGDLVLWDIGVKYELQPGDAVMFYSGVMAHNASEVTSGSRNVVDMFVHRSNLAWAKRQKM